MALKIGNDKVNKIISSRGTITDVECRKVYQGTNVVYARLQCSFNTDGGSYVPPAILYYGETFGTLPTSSKTGHDFGGWFTSSSYATQVQPSTIVSDTDNIILYAKQTIQTFTVTFYDWDGAILKTQTVNYGSNATPPSNPTRTNYTFNGWSGTYTNVTSNRTITATYSINSVPEWEYLYTSEYPQHSFDVTVTFSSPFPSTTKQVLTKLNAQYPASGYSIGTIIRVHATSTSPSSSFYHWYERI